ncbi:hypothetical protein BU24DRAFT_237794 [Aaosphaeria arxii CBS 175.79]|uniref:Uncharacterized protein n=1 Tax=Aaosphaeria arxii CBS 175.79 TaxID=1450172 RepID=A0A6A5XJY8_9PLEO|nr:uncharacterized protein BU24DRAFT_237794 [Aaosphaeria arxii CBS 175.79]KAF2013442.1 hypothetical protein BU24DRAFT_237794 [Aaosphaeria arxii CBS 175.79]
MSNMSDQNPYVPLGEDSHRSDPAHFFRSVFSHPFLINDINDHHYDGDIRPRFPDLRYIRAKWFENNLLNLRSQIYALGDKAIRGDFKPDDKATQASYEQALEALLTELDHYSRIHEQDQLAAQAHSVDKYNLDNVVRHNINPNATHAPNGQPVGFYGVFGSPAPLSLFALRQSEPNFFRQIVLNVLARMYYRLYNRLARVFNFEEQSEAQDISSRAVEVIVGGLECTLSVAYLAGAVLLSVKLSGQMERIIAMSAMSLLFPFTVLFLSEKAMRFFMLCAA